MRIGDLLEMRGVWRGEGREERGLGGFGRFGEGGGGGLRDCDCRVLDGQVWEAPCLGGRRGFIAAFRELRWINY